MKRILSLIGALSFGALTLTNSGCKEASSYNIDGKEIILNGQLIKWFDLSISDNRWYINNPKIINMTTHNGTFDINNKTYEDSVVINEAQKGVDYYLHFIDSTNKANRLSRGLEALK